MAMSKYPTYQYSCEQFVEGCGAVVFDISARKVLLLRSLNGPDNVEYALPKGRRNVNEAPRTTVLREVYEETGYVCDFLPLTMKTRNPPAIQAKKRYKDSARLHEKVCEPFMVTVIELQKGNSDKGIKIIWWYAVAIIEGAFRGTPEKGAYPHWFGFEEVMDKVTYWDNRDVIHKALKLFSENEKPIQPPPLGTTPAPFPPLPASFPPWPAMIASQPLPMLPLPTDAMAGMCLDDEEMKEAEEEKRVEEE